MRGIWPFNKTKNNDKIGPSTTKLKKERDRLYKNVDMAKALHHQNMLVAWTEVHLPGGWSSTRGECRLRRCHTRPTERGATRSGTDVLSCR
jgi:hypothetical protein